MNILGYFIEKEIIFIAFFAIIFLFFIFSLSGWIVAVNLNKKYRRIMYDGAGRDISEQITNYYQKCSSMMDEFKFYSDKINYIQTNLKACAQKVGCVRYNAFGGNNANQSYAVAVLDEFNNGFVLNGVNSRQQTVTYLKPIEGGRSQYELSEEEIEAINVAQSNYKKIMDMNK